MRATTTVFVTVRPSNPVGSKASVDGVVTAGPQKPAKTIVISPIESSVHAHQSISELSTITVTALGPDQQPSGVDSTIFTTGRVEGAQTTSGPKEYSVPAGDVPVQSSDLTTHTRVTILSTHTVTLSKIQPRPSMQSSVNFGGSTCLTYTVLGTNSLPTLTSTWVSVQPSVSCATYAVLGTDGLPTVVETTFPAVSTTPSATQSSIAPPSFVSQPTEGPGRVVGAITTDVTVDIIGANGATSRVVESIVIASDQTIIGVPNNTVIATGLNIPALPSQSSSDHSEWPTGYNSIPVYGSQSVSFPTPSATPSTLDSVTPGQSQVLGDATSLAMPGTPLAPPAYGYGGFSSTELPTVALPPYDSSELADHGSPTMDPADWASSILYGSLPSIVTPSAATPTACNTTILSTGTWTNIIPEQTTTYTMNFPYTTLLTMTVPPLQAFGKRNVRRQE